MNIRFSKAGQTMRSYAAYILMLLLVIICTLTGCAYIQETLATEITAPSTESQPTKDSTSDTYPIDWQLYGKWVKADGTITKTTECVISGTVQLGETGEDVLDLSITFSDDFDYMFSNSTRYYSHSRKYENVTYCVCPTFSYNKSKNDSVMSCFGISLDKKYAIFHWEDKNDLYLVLSTEPDDDPKEILTYFETFVQVYTFDA